MASPEHPPCLLLLLRVPVLFPFSLAGPQCPAPRSAREFVKVTREVRNAGRSGNIEREKQQQISVRRRAKLTRERSRPPRPGLVACPLVRTSRCRNDDWVAHHPDMFGIIGCVIQKLIPMYISAACPGQILHCVRKYRSGCDHQLFSCIFQDQRLGGL